MLRLKKFSGEKYVLDMYKEHTGNSLRTDKTSHTYLLYNKDKVVGYIVLKIVNKCAKIDWIYAPGYGKTLMKKMEQKFKREGVSEIKLNVSIDPTERKDKVMRRINFYISLEYKVYDIKWRKKYGPLLYMVKYL